MTAGGMQSQRAHRSSVERFAGVVDAYDRFRPGPPEVLASLLTGYAGGGVPALVVDLGCGTGVSTRYWTGRARAVIGVEPSADMLQQALAVTTAANVSYRPGWSHQTGLADGCADIVLCSNSLHWMDPAPTLAEVARLLRPGGVFAAYYHNQFPFTLHWELDRLLREFRERVVALDAERELTAPARRWRREDHLADMRASGLFRFTQELGVHQSDSGNAQRLAGIAMCNGYVRSLLRHGMSEAEFGLDVFRAEADRVLGAEPRPWLWSVSLWIGVV